MDAEMVARLRESPHVMAIQTALLSNFVQTRVNEGELREAVCAYVADLRAAGVPPERMLRAVKQVLSDVTAAPVLDVSRARDHDAERRLVERAVTWCIEAYYE